MDTAGYCVQHNIPNTRVCEFMIMFESVVVDVKYSMDNFYGTQFRYKNICKWVSEINKYPVFEGDNY